MEINTSKIKTSNPLIQSRIRDILRPIFAVICGIIAGILLINSIQHGIQFRYNKEYSFDLWGIIVWGDHWFLRFLASSVATYLGAFIAGMIARKNGDMVGALSSTPTAITWVVISYLSWIGRFEVFGESYETTLSLMYKITATALSLTSGFFGIHGGTQGANLGAQIGSHFDTRHFSLLGTKWYHFLWIFLPLHLIIAQTAWILLYAGDWYKITWTTESSILNIIATFFLMAIYGSLYLTIQGIWKAYLILSGINYAPKLKERIVGVSKFGCGLPLLAVLTQSLIALLHNLAIKVLEWFN